MIARWRGIARDENGQAMVLVAIFMAALVAVAGLVADGGGVLVQRRDLQNVADAAAAAGAMRVNEVVYRESRGEQVLLDTQAARATAIEYLAYERVEYAVNADVSRVQVEVSRTAQTAFLRLLGIRGVTINAEAVAEPRHGISGSGS